MTIRYVAFATLALSLMIWSGCSKPTKDSKKKAYESIKAELKAEATKKPALKPGIEATIKGYDTMMAAAEKKDGEDGLKAMQTVIDLAKKYKDSLAKAPATGTKKPAAATPPTTKGTPPPKGKLGGGTPPTAKPTPAPAPAPAPKKGGSGFGGK